MLVNQLSVTALCLTRNRRGWLPKAIQCFVSQGYTHKELLIVADGEDVRDLIPDDPRVRLHVCADQLTVGVKRNIGCQLASGEVIAIWDDDDFSSPDRLEDQVRRLQNTGKSVTGYRTMKFTDGAKWWIYEGTPGFALATSMCFLKSWWTTHPFGNQQIGQDERFGSDALAASQMDSTEREDMMYATIHPGNTSPRNLENNSSFKPITVNG